MRCACNARRFTSSKLLKSPSAGFAFFHVASFQGSSSGGARVQRQMKAGVYDFATVKAKTVVNQLRHRRLVSRRLGADDQHQRLRPAA